MWMLTIDKRHTATRFTGLEQQRIATPAIHPRIRRDHEPQALRAACRAIAPRHPHELAHPRELLGSTLTG